MSQFLKTYLPFHDGLASRWFCLRQAVRNASKRNTGRPVVFLEATALGDRHLYLLAEFFIQAGYFVSIVGGIRKELYYYRDPYYFYVFSSKNINFVKEVGSGDLGNALLCTDRAVPGHQEERFPRILRLSYDIDIAPENAGAVVILPYPMHPNVYKTGQLARIPELRGRPKTVGVFFAGNLKDQYARTTRLLRGMLPRAVAVQGVLRRFKERVRLFTTREALLRALDEEDLAASIVVFDATTARLGREEWFPVLARSRFFLALPGVVMPMCHNGVEAMALGAVPILGYGHLFSPRLRSGAVCLEYASEAELAGAIETALAMDAAAYDGLRGRAMDHFDRHMEPAAFLEALLRGPARVIDVRFPAEFVSEAVAGGNGTAG
uniref:Glycosyltransferase n=1 Tax=Desulfovibrio sp. U5L TaxID=596152 RepID=I2PZZ3_9BACT